MSAGMMASHTPAAPASAASADAPKKQTEAQALKAIQSTVISCVSPSGVRLTDDEVYRSVMMHVCAKGSMPAPPQIMWAAPSTQPSEITAFVMRAAAFPKMRFAIIAVNRLGVPAREALMRAILTRRGRRAALALVFTEATGQTSLSLVMRREEVANSAGLSTAKQIRGYRGPAGKLFSAVMIVAGESGSGKSTWIKRDAAKRVGAHVLSAAIHSELDVASLMEDYDKTVRAAILEHPKRSAATAAAAAAAAAAAPAAPAAAPLTPAQTAAAAAAATAAAATAAAAAATAAATAAAAAAAAARPPPAQVVQAGVGMPTIWVCLACTLHNPWDNVACATCAAEQVCVDV
jgi:hypothetical protein